MRARMKVRVERVPVRVPGFAFGIATAGLRASGRPDVAVVASERPAAVAAAFTRNRVRAAPVVVAREHAAGGRARAVVVNSGNANACTGAAGIATARAACAAAGLALGLPARHVLPCSTGKIGVPLPRARLLAGVDAACAALSPAGFWDAAAAITTTDAFVKGGLRHLDVGGRRITIAAMAKGAGMIAPDMATLLGFAFTDARIAPGPLRRALRTALSASFQTITVDGDTSTNDTVIVLANGAAGNPTLVAGSRAHDRFTAALAELFGDLARLVVLDGEGASRCVEIVVRGAPSGTGAARVARTIATSTLTRAALHGADPNWGRILCAAGYAGVPFDPSRARIWIAGVAVVRGGVSCGGERAAARAMRRREYRIVVDLGSGRATGRMLTTDLSPAYVRFNSAYST
jgi:glutamate N-acetyltransferase/amino-acid N-acetyltransferase